MKILFLASNPENTAVLKLDEEIRAITAKMRSSEYRDVFNLISCWAVRPDDLLQELNTHKPTIVHFSGHGGVGEIVLMDANRQAKVVNASALRALFKMFNDIVRLVVLNACYSKAQAMAISDTVDCVIGMNTAIGDEAAINFSASFYRAVGFGYSVEKAFEQGKISLMLEGIPEDNTPELLVRQGVDPSSIFLSASSTLSASAESSFSHLHTRISDVGLVNTENYSLIEDQNGKISIRPRQSSIKSNKQK